MKKYSLYPVILSLLLALLISSSVVYGAPGDFLFKWGAKFNIDYPQAVAVGTSGKVYVAANNEIYVFDGTGHLLRTFGKGTLAYPVGVAVDAAENVYVTDAGNYQVTVFDRTGNLLRSWGSQATYGDGQFFDLSGIAVDRDGNVYVADSGYKFVVPCDQELCAEYYDRIQVFDRFGKFLRSWGSTGSGDGQFASGRRGIAVDALSNVYVADTGNDRVQLFDTSGNFLRKFGSAGGGDGQFVEPMAIAVAKDGTIYVTDLGADRINHRVQLFDNSGQFIRKWGKTGTGHGEFNVPAGIAVRNSRIYVAQNTLSRIEVFDPFGKCLTQWGSNGDGKGEFYNPYDVDISATGEVYVVDAVNSRIQVFTTGGHYLRQWGEYGSGDGQFSYPTGAALYKNRLYVADSGNNRIQVFDRNGKLLFKWGTEGSGDGQFSIVRDVAITANGTVFVVDLFNYRIQVFDAAGNFIGKWGSYGLADGQFQLPTDVAIAPSGDVYVVDPYGKVDIFDSRGNFLRKWDRSNFSMDIPTGITIDRSGRVYVSDAGNFITYVEPDGTPIGQWGGSGHDDGQFHVPEGMALDPSGRRIYVADEANNRIEVFEAFPLLFNFSGAVYDCGRPRYPLAGASVTIDGKTATTSSDGTFTVSDLPAGVYALNIAKSGYTSRAISRYFINDNQSGVEFCLSAQRYSVSGVVRQSGPTGPVVAGATVSIGGRTGITGRTGTFTIGGVPAGSNTVTISKRGYQTQTVTDYLVGGNISNAIFYLNPQLP
jgi:tripartite motif-containing protein 71